MFGRKSTKKKNNRIINENFRNLFNEIIYVKPDRKTRKHLREMLNFMGKGDGFLAYGFIDDDSGFNFRLLCSASVKKGMMTMGKFDDTGFLAVHRRVLDHCEFMVIDNFQVDTSHLSKEIKMINKTYSCVDPKIQKMREKKIMDEFRSREHPDDIRVDLYNDQIGVELVWVRCCDSSGQDFTGRLINEPYKNFGVHKGDMIEFSIVRSEGELVSIGVI